MKKKQESKNAFVEQIFDDFNGIKNNFYQFDRKKLVINKLSVRFLNMLL